MTDSLHELMDRFEKEQIPALARSRCEAEAAILAALDTVEAENEVIVSQIDKNAKVLNQLFVEFESLKDKYLAHCVEQFRVTELHRKAAEHVSPPPATRWRSQHDVVENQTKNKFTTIEEDGFQPAWTKQTHNESHSQAPTRAESYSTNAGLYPPSASHITDSYSKPSALYPPSASHRYESYSASAPSASYTAESYGPPYVSSNEAYSQPAGGASYQAKASSNEAYYQSARGALRDQYPKSPTNASYGAYSKAPNTSYPPNGNESHSKSASWSYATESYPSNATYDERYDEEVSLPIHLQARVPSRSFPPPPTGSVIAPPTWSAPPTRPPPRVVPNF